MSRKEFAQAVLVKNAAEFGLGITVWWVVGVGFAYGNVDSKFLGHKDWAGDEWWGTGIPTLATITGLAGISVIYIINGAITERTQLLPFFLLTFLLMIFVWPVVVGWTWGGGFLSSMETGFEDIGGVAVIHVFAGVFALVGALFTGKRAGKWGSDHPNAPVFQFFNPAYLCVGTILYFLHLCFMNAAYAPTLISKGTAVFNTWLSAGTCAIVTALLGTLDDKSIETHFITVLRGFIAGAVLVAGVAWNMEGWASFTFGVFGGAFFVGSLRLEDWFHIDDVTKAISVHLTMGLVGTFGVGLWDRNRGGFHGEDGSLIGSQLGGELAIAAWASVFAVALFGLCALGRVLRVPSEVEMEGMNEAEVNWKGFSSPGKQAHQVQPSDEALATQRVGEDASNGALQSQRQNGESQEFA